MSILVKFEQRAEGGIRYHYGESVDEVLNAAFGLEVELLKKELFRYKSHFLLIKYMLAIPQIAIFSPQYQEFHGLIFADEVL